MRLSVGYNGKLETLEKLFKIPVHKIKNVYTGGIKDFLKGGRNQYIDSIKELEKQVIFSKENDITLSIVLNTPLNIREKNNKEWWSKFENYIKILENIGVDGVILSHPFLIEKVRESSNLKITASAICEISSPIEAEYYEKLGADIIVPSTKINYNLDTLLKIKHSLKSAELKLIANEYCLMGCPFRKFHWNHIASEYYDNDNDYSDSCSSIYLNSPHKVLSSSVIRPEDLHKYSEITDYFKLIGRTKKTEDSFLEDTIKSYSQENYQGNFINLSSYGLGKYIKIDNHKLKNLFELKKNCDFNCNICKKCEVLYKNIVD